MPSLGGRVPQVAKKTKLGGMMSEFQCPLWADGSRRHEGEPASLAVQRRFNALFGRTGPAGVPGGRRSARLPMFQCPLWADGSRRGFKPTPPKPRLNRFNALFGRTGPAGPARNTRRFPPNFSSDFANLSGTPLVLPPVRPFELAAQVGGVMVLPADPIAIQPDRINLSFQRRGEVGSPWRSTPAGTKGREWIVHRLRGPVQC